MSQNPNGQSDQKPSVDERGRLPSLWRRARRWLRSLRGRLVATTVLTAALIAAVGFMGLTAVLHRNLAANADVALQARLDTVQTQLANRSSFDEALNGLAAGSAVIAVYSADGSVLATSTSQRLPSDWAAFAEPAHWPTSTHAWSTHHDDAPFRAMARQVTVNSRRYLIAVGESLLAADAAADSVERTLTIVIPLLILFIGAGAWWISKAALRPVERMRTDVQVIGENDTGARITVPDTGDSIAELATTFNELLDRLQTSLSRQRQLVADAGHELRTPLAVLQLELETAVRPSRTREDLVDSIVHARAEAGRLSELSNNLLLLADADSGRVVVAPEPTDVVVIVGEAKRGFLPGLDAGSLSVAATHRGPTTVIVDPQALRRILDNLLSNSIRHTPAGGRIEIETAVSADFLLLTVHDSGPGFPEQFLPLALQRFTRADTGRRRDDLHAGSGLGLSIVAALAAAHGGTVQVANAVDGGAMVTVRLGSTTK